MATMMVRADALMCGDLVDLEGDEYADPNRDHPAFEFEWQRVLDYKWETQECIAITFEHDVIGFPIDHLLLLEIR